MTLPENFIRHASDVLGDTDTGLTGSVIVKEFTKYSIRFNTDIPHSSIPMNVSKRNFLFENLVKFKPEYQYKIILELSDHNQVNENDKIKELKLLLIERYSELGSKIEIKNVNKEVVTETIQWLKEYPISLKSYNEAIRKLEASVFERNLLDDLRLSFESLLKKVLNNEKTLENQQSYLGDYLKQKAISPELRNLINLYRDYFTKYQNNYVKHNDKVNKKEIEYIFEVTTSLMKLIIRLENTD
ncbi:MAG: hypothetical protein N3A71_02090 [Candidatus Dojkabacteria bacterium]|nr:hypothetical protein [Candidatus Dojkabacteria bacterium]